MNWPSPPVAPSEIPLQIVETMLQNVAESTAEQDFTPESWEVGETACRDLLRAFMARNENQYDLVVAGIFGDHGTPIPGTGTDEVVIHVVFPDGSKVHIQFYGNILNTCRPLEKSD